MLGLQSPMRNVWTNYIDRALLYLDYNTDSIDAFNDKEKEAIIIDEYLFILRNSADECVLSLEEMAECIIDYYKGR